MYLTYPILLLTLALSPSQEIKAERVKKGTVLEQESVMITPPAWLLLRAHFAGPRCEAALDRCAQECAHQVSLVDCALVDSQEVVDLQRALRLQETELRSLEYTASQWKWAAISAGAVLVVSSVAVAVSQR